jgi:diguanylate cyclase (GGDEF)-like protein
LFLALFTLTQVLLFVVAGNFPRKYDFDQPRAVYNVVVSISCASLIYFLLLLMLFERLNEKLVVQAMRDSLTDVYNRRAFEEIAFREISGARRSGMPLALIVCDIDRFKAINDTFGHLAGDEVLLDVARLLRANLRDEDTLCRWGGDEFVALLPRAGSEDAHQAARRIALAFENGLFHVAKTQIPVSVSLGVAAGDRLNGDLPALLQEADQAMYRAKQRFREAATVAAAAAEPVAQPPA